MGADGVHAVTGDDTTSAWQRQFGDIVHGLYALCPIETAVFKVWAPSFFAPLLTPGKGHGVVAETPTPVQGPQGHWVMPYMPGTGEASSSGAAASSEAPSPAPALKRAAEEPVAAGLAAIAAAAEEAAMRAPSLMVPQVVVPPEKAGCCRRSGR